MNTQTTASFTAFLVRHFRPSDRAQVRALVACYRDDLAIDVLSGTKRLPTRDALFHAFLAVDGARVLGGIWFVEHTRVVELVDLLVDPAATKGGIGAALLREALLIADSHCLPVVTRVRETDEVGLYWLRDRGFTATRLERGAFGDRDAVAMRRAPAAPIVKQVASKIRIAE